MILTSTLIFILSQKHDNQYKKGNLGEIFGASMSQIIYSHQIKNFKTLKSQYIGKGHEQIFHGKVSAKDLNKK